MTAFVYSTTHLKEVERLNIVSGDGIDAQLSTLAYNPVFGSRIHLTAMDVAKGLIDNLLAC